MRKPVSDQIMEIKPSGIRRFFDYAADMPQAISLGVGEPDFDTPKDVKEAVIEAMEKGASKYTASAGTPECLKAVADYDAAWH